MVEERAHSITQRVLMVPTEERAKKAIKKIRPSCWTVKEGKQFQHHTSGALLTHYIYTKVIPKYICSLVMNSFSDGSVGKKDTRGG